MTGLEILFLALALSIDACVVSFSYGLAFNQDRLKNMFLLASFTGFFQGFMPCIGYFLTQFVKDIISPYANIIVFTIFLFLGIKFIKEAFQKEKNAPCCIGIGCLLLIGIATSIDAFSAGISLALYGNKILVPALLITIITFINSSLGFTFGGKFKHLPSIGMEICAGLILICLGLKAII
jgi:putative Mn2+ efflux pump MntP